MALIRTIGKVAADVFKDKALIFDGTSVSIQNVSSPLTATTTAARTAAFIVDVSTYAQLVTTATAVPYDNGNVILVKSDGTTSTNHVVSGSSAITHNVTDYAYAIVLATMQQGGSSGTITLTLS